MSNARKLADLLDSAGDVKLANLDNAVRTTSASDLTSGTLPIARIADDAITNAKMADDAIDSAQIAAGAVDDAHLATGISSSKLTGALPALDGSSLTGVGGGPVAKAANYTAVDGDSLIITAGSITITLPASPTAGDTVVVKDGTGAAATTNWTVARNGSNIASSATDLTFDKNWAEITMTYVDATVGWSV